MTKRFLRVLPLLLLLAVPNVAVRAQEASIGTGRGIDILLKQADYWLLHGREDLTVADWQRVLKVDPAQPDALRGLTLYQARHGNFAAATEGLATLQKQPAMQQTAQRVAALLAIGPAAAPAIAQAAKAMAAQHPDAAVAAYQRAFGTQPPAAWADAYDQALAKTAHGWARAVQLARSQHQAQPHTAGYRLALGRLLIARATTRLEGIDLLADLADSHSSVQTTAAIAWRQGLGWLGTDPHGIAALKRYLRGHADATLRKNLAAMQASQHAIAHKYAYGHALASAFAQLRQKHVDAAHTQFLALARQRPHNAKAVEGLADVAQQRHHMQRAAALYARAADLAPTDAERLRLQKLARTAQQAQRQQAAAAAYQSGQAARAETLYRQQLQADPDDAVALVRLAHMQADAGHVNRAARLFGRLTRIKPDTLDGWVGLLDAYRQQNQAKQVLATQARMPPGLRAKAFTRADYAGDVAWAQGQTGQPESGVHTLDMAIAALPTATSIGPRIARGWLLYQAHDDAALYQSLQWLRQAPGLTVDQQAKVRALYLTASQREAQQAYAAGHTRIAQAIVANLASNYPHDDGVARVRAALLVARKKFKQAVAIYQRVGPDATADGYRAAAGAALAAGAMAPAQRWALAGLKLAPNDVDLTLQAAHAEVAMGQARAARTRLLALRQRLPEPQAPQLSPAATKAYPFAQASKAAAATVTMPKAVNDAYPFASAAPASAPGSAALAMSQPAAASARRRIDAMLTQIRGQTTPQVGGGLYSRSRSGEPGMGQMAEIAVQTDADVALSSTARVGLHAAWVRLDAGSPTATGATKLGTAPLHPAAVKASQPHDVSAHGTAVAVTLHLPHLKLSLGTTPQSFPVHGVTADVRWSPAGTPFTLHGFRQPVRDSVLSYAGMRDTYSGKLWGGVFANGLGLNYGAGRNGRDYRYASVSLASLRGRNVRENHRIVADVGAMWPALGESPLAQAGVGFDVLGLSYDHNLSHFTLGQGGYFSPAYYLRPSLAFKLEGRAQQHFAYAISGRLGWQMFHQSGSALFPTTAADEAASAQKRYPGEVVQGLGFGLDAHVTWAWQRQLFLTGFLSTGNSQDYTNVVAGLWFVYAFAPQTTPPRVAMPSLPPPLGGAPL